MYDRMFYSVETIDGRKVIHYTTYSVENGEVPDCWDEDDYLATGETSVDVIDLTFLYVFPSIIAGLDKDEFARLIEGREIVSQQYIDRLIEHDFKEWLDGCDYPHLDMWDVTDDTPCGTYWSNGYWRR